MVECFTLHDGRKISCPESRIDEGASYLELPFPSCEKNDIIKFTYRKTSEYPIVNRFWSANPFFFEKSYPIEEISLSLTVPEGLDISYNSSLDLLPELDYSDESVTYLWEKKDVEPYELENHMPPVEDVLSSVSYSSLKSWDEVKSWIEDLFRNATREDKVKRKTNQIIEGLDDEGEKIKVLYEWVRDEIRYEDSELGFLTGYQPHNADEVLKYKFGDCKDKAVLLASLLESAGIRAYPALVSWGDVDKQIPNPNEFYHVIVYVPDVDGGLWFDAACEICPLGYIPPSEQDVEVLVLSSLSVDFTRTPVFDVDVTTVTNVNYSIDLSAEGDAQVFILYQTTGLNALSLRDGLEDAIDDEDIKDAVGFIVGGVCSDFDYVSPGLTDLSDYVIQLRLKVECNHFATKSDDNLVYHLVENSFYYITVDDELRVYPLELDGGVRYLQHQSIRVPLGYAVNLMPENFSSNRSFAMYELGCSKTEDSVSCLERWFEDEVSLMPSEFSSFRDFYIKINSLKKSIVFSPVDDAVIVNVSGASTTSSSVVSVSTSSSTLAGSGLGDSFLLYLLLGAGFVIVLLVGVIVFIIWRR